MSAPQRPVDAAAWTAPPGAPPSARRPRGIVVLAVLVVGGALVVGGWALLRGQTAEAPGVTAEAPGVSGEQPAPEGLPAPEPEADPSAVDPALGELRATDHYVALAEHDRAAAAVQAGDVPLGWNKFEVVDDGEVIHEWTNKAELWDAVVPPLRDELLLLGPPYTEPMWDETNPFPAAIGTLWNDESTGGRGTFIEIMGRYYDEVRDLPVRLHWGVLIATRADGSGEVVARMPPIELVPSQATNFRHAMELMLDAAWEWVRTQPVLDTGDA